ncbi:epidermal growth factor receptor kinase substrate 8-like protein 3 isoform X2 [Lates calcarifer]|uniref:Epidermal growth factor receptor kinase substrate 8-like protein 3 isoform X2 n=1 Tax=Lates calcarifer TaxID=8187 RepID=A0AAJ7PRR3_LATCA|nr:epidermal growth factor receptor kinase substrate 8-like protein 3 isoform X2 [Lates calcarifer]
MFRSNSPFGNDTNSFTGSVLSNGNSTMTMDEVSSQVSGLSRPSAKSIYLQRKEYAVSINKMMDKFQYRVEHLFTCDLDGKELRTVADCVERLKLLDGMGRVWGQNMLLEVRGVNLLLTDIETKEELELLALSDILELKAVLDAGVFNSLLTMSVQTGRNKTTVFMFQCDDVRADHIQRDLSRALSRRRENPSFNGAGLTSGVKNHHNAAATPEPTAPRPAAHPQPLWTSPDYEEDDIDEPELAVAQEEEAEEVEEEEVPPYIDIPSQRPFRAEEEPLSPPRRYTELERSVDILNHIVSDIEIFMGKVATVVAKNSKKKKKKKGKVMDGMPSTEEFETYFHKTKYALNLLGELNGKIHNPSAPELVHSLFSTLAFVVSHCPDGMPPTIVAPLLMPQCIRLMSEEASPEEDQLWQSLGDAWNIPSTQWPEDDEDIPTYTLEFSDGWQPPEVSDLSEPVSRQDSPRPAPSQTSAKWTPPHHPQKSRSGHSQPRPMRVKSDFISRNHRELTVRKGEIVEVLDTSKQWWKVRNNSREEGYIPNNVLETPDDEQPYEQIDGTPVLSKRSKPAEVKAWLEDKGFSKITIRCLGVLSGSMLLGMTREELKTVCPEEGGRVFFQLQAVKSTMAAAD